VNSLLEKIAEGQLLIGRVDTVNFINVSSFFKPTSGVFGSIVQSTTKVTLKE